MIECFNSERIHGPCSVCGQPTKIAHVAMGVGVPSAIFCEAHCPVHKQASMEWDHEPPKPKDAAQLPLAAKGAE
jgi:hypothetical protein